MKISFHPSALKAKSVLVGLSLLFIAGCHHGHHHHDNHSHETKETVSFFESIVTTDNGRIFIRGNEYVTIHSYLSNEKLAAVTTHIIETPDHLVLIDGQFTVPGATDVIAYANTLGKPIERIMVSHGHPDHWFGLAEFDPSISVYADAGTVKFLKVKGDDIRSSRAKKLGDVIPSSTRVPDLIITDSTVTVDGVDIIVETVDANEAKSSLLFKVPALNALIVQDIIYNNLHAFTGNNTLPLWIAEIERITTENADYDYVLAGHGIPGSMDLFDAQIEYLTFAQQALKNSTSAEEFKTQLIEAYPEHDGAFLIDISNKFLFKQGAN